MNVMKGAVRTADFLHSIHTAPKVVYNIVSTLNKGGDQGDFPLI